MWQLRTKQDMRHKLRSLYEQYPRIQGFQPVYGTAGFRYPAQKLHFIVLRSAICMAIRSAVCKEPCGIMITASHNAAEDNGLKLISGGGNMIEDSWETLITKVVNFDRNEHDNKTLDCLINFYKFVRKAYWPRIVIGIDTRDSGPRLIDMIANIFDVMGVSYVECGMVTTPQVHKYVEIYHKYRQFIYEDYYIILQTAYRDVTQMLGVTQNSFGRLWIDCANGVGGITFEEFKQFCPEFRPMLVNIGQGGLNRNCGAEHVHKTGTPPEKLTVYDGMYGCSLDGDADRIVYYTVIDGKFCVIDGDKIATLFATFCRQALGPDVKIGMVQTPYANGASTEYIRNRLGNQVDTCFAPTGVKHLHHAAQKYDVGIYFESNGHGTVLFSRSMIKKSSLARSISRLMSQTVGDSLSCIMLVDIALHYLGWTPRQWESVYNNFYCQNEKVKVANKDLFKTSSDESRLVSCPNIQMTIDTLVQNHVSSHVRCFVRPSGTEDVVRIYTEGSDATVVHAISDHVQKVVEVYK